MHLRPFRGCGRARVTELWSGREALSAREIAALDMPVDDRVSALLRLLAYRWTALQIALTVFTGASVSEADSQKYLNWIVEMHEESAR
ncbi:MAG: hypothetical protein JW704_00670 [Anaerolineaceae bacterium]|nr:hypothetical protein [Anaerolineaceae bacterium]